MKKRLLNEAGGQRTIVVILDQGDEVVDCLQKIAHSERLTGAHLTALGAFSSAELYFFDWESKRYNPILVNEQTEVATLVGDIALGPDGEPVVHCHVVLGRPNGSALAGHLSKGIARPTLEVIIEESPAHLCRVQDDETGLTLIDPKVDR